MAKRRLTEQERRLWLNITKDIVPFDPETPLEMPDINMTDPDKAGGLKRPMGAPLGKADSTKPFMAKVGPEQNALAAQAPSPPLPASFQTSKRTESLLSNKKSGMIQDVKRQKRIRRGQVHFTATLDLHGLTQDSAHQIWQSFFLQHKRAGHRAVLIITGKGKQGDGILRRRFLDWLSSSEAHALIYGYASAHQKHGGSGAWYVFLRRA